MYNKLLYGKDQTERIVSVEANDGSLELFIQKEDGSIESEFVPNKYWLLSDKRLGTGFVRLSGNLHYCWGTQFKNRSDFQKARSYYKKQDIYSIYDAKEASLVNKGITYFKGMKREEVSILSFDIETTGLDKNADDAKVLLIANTFRDSKGNITRRMFTYEDGDDLFENWCAWVREINPSIITGHNIFSFDLPYISSCADRIGSQLALGRDDSNCIFETFESKFRKDSTQFYHYNKARIYGREIIDTLFLSIRYDVGRKYESYALKQIIKQEGLEVKDRQFYDANEIRFNYHIPEEWEKIKAYAMYDADDALALYDLMSAPFFYMNQMIPKSYQELMCSATGSQVNSMMVRSYLQDRHSIPKATEGRDYQGAISYGNPGIYNNAWKLDVASLYPSIIREYQVYNPEKDPNANFLTIVDTLTVMRLDYKSKADQDKYFDNMQNAYKILINSAYGFLGTEGLNFNHPPAAAFITETGREVLEKSIKWAESKNFRIVNVDTDSIMFCKPDMTEFTTEEKTFLLNDLNSLYPEKIKFTDDGEYIKVIVIRAKNYVLHYFDKKKNKTVTKTKGSALKATLKPPALKEFINVMIDTLINDKTNFMEIYNRYIKEIYNIKDIKRWATKKTVTEKVLTNDRANEANVRDAIDGTDYAAGDRIYIYYDNDDNVKLVENWDNDHSKPRLLKNLFDTAEVFDTVIDTTQFLNYKLKRNQNILKDLLTTL